MWDRRHCLRIEVTHSRFIGLAPNPLSPPTITQSSAHHVDKAAHNHVHPTKQVSRKSV